MHAKHKVNNLRSDPLVSRPAGLKSSYSDMDTRGGALDPEVAALKIQRSFRAYLWRKRDAIFRSRSARPAASGSSGRSLMTSAVVTSAAKGVSSQSVRRSTVSRSRPDRAATATTTAEESAALTIQRMFRGHRVRDRCVYACACVCVCVVVYVMSVSYACVCVRVCACVLLCM